MVCIDFRKEATVIQSILSAFLALLTFLSSFISSFEYNVNYYYYEDIYYGTHERQCFDIAIPGDCDETVGLVLYIHGGSWTKGDKSSRESRVRSTVDEHRLVSATMNYRYASETTDCFDMLDDIDSALAEIKSFCKKKDIDINKVILVGNSSGAHISLLYAYSRAATAPIEPAGVIAYCPPTALYLDSLINGTTMGSDRQMAKLLSKVCGQRFTPGTKFVAEEALHLASPVDFVTPYTVPTLIAHGSKDGVISFEHSELLERKLSENGVPHELIVYPNSGHYLDKDPDASKIMQKKVPEWFNTYLK